MSWVLDRDELEPIALGCAMLGSGGGGDTHCAILMLRHLLERGCRIPIVDPDDLDRDGVSVNVGFLGAPLVLAEKLFNGAEISLAIDTMQTRLDRPVRSLIAAEIGGMNGMVPLIASALTGLPVVDGDGMGRAFPRSDQVTYAFNGVSSLPTVMASEHGTVVVIDRATNADAEDLARAISATMGCMAFSVDYPLSADQLRAFAVPRTLSLARAIGSAIGRAKGPDARLAALIATLREERGVAAGEIFAGRIMSCERTTRGGFDVGTLAIRRPDAPEDVMRIEFQNEFLTASRGDRTLASTPDIISIVDADSLRPIPSETVRYGQNVRVLAIEAPCQLRTPAALRAVGPRAFGYDFDYRPIGTLSV